MAKPLLLVVCGALVVARAQWGASVTPAGTSEPPDAPTVAPTEDETLQNEADNQENVLSQVGGGPWPPPGRGAGWRGDRRWPSSLACGRPLRPVPGGRGVRGALLAAFLRGRDGYFKVTESGERREGREDSAQLPGKRDVNGQ